MTTERGQRVYAAFEAVLKCDPTRRAVLLEGLCIGDPELRAEVERLLAQHAEAERDRFLATPAWTPGERRRRDESAVGESEPTWSRSPGGQPPRPPATAPPGLADHPDYRSSGNSGGAGWASSTWRRIASRGGTKSSR